MVFATHTIVGLGLTSALAPQSAVVAFTLSLAGHYLSDMIPHWQYAPAFIKSDEKDKLNAQLLGGFRRWFSGLALIGLDLAIGLIAGLWLFNVWSRVSVWVVVASVVGSILPDLLQPLYFVFHRQPWTSLQKFHNFWHSRRPHLEDPVSGILTQVALVAIFTLVVKLLF